MLCGAVRRTVERSELRHLRTQLRRQRAHLLSEGYERLELRRHDHGP
jgi:hypothetical protein